MNSNLFLRELRSNLKSLIVWTAIITFLITATMSLYSIFLENNSKILAMISILPEGTLQFKGVSDVNDLFSVLGFYSANNVIMDLGFLYMTGIHSLRIGAFLQNFGLDTKYIDQKFKMPQLMKLGVSGEVCGDIADKTLNKDCPVCGAPKEKFKEIGDGP